MRGYLQKIHGNTGYGIDGIIHVLQKTEHRRLNAFPREPWLQLLYVSVWALRTDVSRHEQGTRHTFGYWPSANSALIVCK